MGRWDLSSSFQGRKGQGLNALTTREDPGVVLPYLLLTPWETPGDPSFSCP